MTGTQAIVFAASLVAGILLFNAVLWTIIVRGRRRKAAALTSTLVEELAAIGARILRGPCVARFTGSPDQPHTSAGGIAALTDQRWVFRTYGGKNLDVALADVTGLRDDKWFRGKMRGGRRHIIFATAPGEIGFMVPSGELASWMTEVRQAIDGAQAASR